MHFKKHVFIYGMYVCVYICIPNIYIYIYIYNQIKDICGIIVVCLISIIYIVYG